MYGWVISVVLGLALLSPSSVAQQRMPAQEPQLPGASTVEPGKVQRLLGVMAKQAIALCWNIRSEEAKSKQIIQVEMRLDPDGRLQDIPRVLPSDSGEVSTEAAKSAVKALLNCEPYNFPPEWYEHWRHMIITFDAEMMFVTR